MCPQQRAADSRHDTVMSTGHTGASSAPLSGEWPVSRAPYQISTRTEISPRANGHRPMARVVSRA